MKNALKFLGLIALVAVIGFSFAACGDAEQGPAGPQGEKGDPGGMIPYIPTESGLLDTIWTVASDPLQALIISDDGYTFTRFGTNSGTHQLLSYWKGEDGTIAIQLILPGSSSRFARIGISGNTLTWGDDTLTKNTTALPSIPTESGLRGTTWIENDSNPYTVTFSGDGSTFDRKWGTVTPTTFTVSRYWKQADGTHVVIATSSSGSTTMWVSSNYTKEE